MSYSAIVSVLKNVRNHPNADRLNLATVANSQIVIGKNHQEGELGLYFDTDGQLSDEFCKANDLYPRFDDEGKRLNSGFIDPKNRRIRSQKFRGEKSEGFWLPISCLDYITGGMYDLKEGDRIVSISDHPICNKYITAKTLLRRDSKTSLPTRDCPFFKKHVDTEKWKHVKDSLKAGDVIYLTEKLHGTSGRYGNTLVRREPPKGLLNKLREIVRPGPKYEYKHVLGSRNVIKNEHSAPGYYGSEEFRWQVLEANNLVDSLAEGETLYFEIVGFVDGEKPIMASHNLKPYKKDFPDLYKEYGDTVQYTYGQPIGTCQMYVYRITQTGNDGRVVELSWPQVKRRCKELNILHVPEIGILNYPYFMHSGSDTHVLSGLGDEWEYEDSFVPGQYCEGICIRIEREDGTVEFAKYKNFAFGVMEGWAKTDEKYEDMEESS